jgi:hypothetical protein
MEILNKLQNAWMIIKAVVMFLADRKRMSAWY